MPKDLRGEEVAKGVDPVTGHTPIEKGQPQVVRELPTISIISHPSKVMLRIILNRLKSKAEELLAEEQT
ncbi:hypothetical protein DPMN_074533 [Dreissena polymorpha]|uniref:Uncharacterized protein n=1 Tax=Dreissena polymorpha TaxID=45954 RepID=A0A9D3YIP3_DREPO|nr:hypothetical protein DPMN_074533 [Dreissena polymorpha]